MSNLKHTKEYAIELSNTEVSSLEADAFVKGYMMAIEKTNSEGLLESLIGCVDILRENGSGCLSAVSRARKAIEKATE